MRKLKVEACKTSKLFIAAYAIERLINLHHSYDLLQFAFLDMVGPRPSVYYWVPV